MKTVIKFIGLKIVEISLIVFIPWGIGSIFSTYFPGWFSPELPWLTGILVLIMCTLTGCLLVAFVWANWIWAKKIGRDS